MNKKVIRNWIIIAIFYIAGVVTLLILNGSWQLLISLRFFFLTLAFLIAMATQPFLVGTVLDGHGKKRGNAQISPDTQDNAAKPAEVAIGAKDQEAVE